VLHYWNTDNITLTFFERFWSIESLDEHKGYCNQYCTVRLELSETGTKLYFENYERTMRFVVYADI